MIDPLTLWRSQFILGASLPDHGHLGMVRHSVGSLDLWASSELHVAAEGSVTVLGLVATVSGDSLTSHFASISPHSDADSVAELTLDLTGRFVVVAALASGVILIPDGIASKRVFLSVDGMIASSSEILLHQIDAPVRPRTEAERNIVNYSRLTSREYATLGLYSVMSGYRRLLPNRMANLTTGKTELRSPATVKKPSTVPDVARSLRSNLAALSRLGPVHIGLTAGFDSRLILATFEAEGLEVDTFTFTDSGPTKRADAEVAEKVASAVGYRHETILEPEPDFRILHLLEASQALVRPLPHVLRQLTWLSRLHEQRLIVSGLGGEISRSRFGLVPKWIGREATRRVVLGHAPDPHDLQAFDEWWEDRYSTSAGRSHLPATTMHHWEQRVAIWGAQFMSEKDLFADEVAGFASGRLQQSLVSFPQIQRTSLTSALFMQLIEELSPRVAGLAPPERSPLKFRAYNATPLPRFMRTLRPGWGRDS